MEITKEGSLEGSYTSTLTVVLVSPEALDEDEVLTAAMFALGETFKKCTVLILEG